MKKLMMNQPFIITKEHCRFTNWDDLGPYATEKGPHGEYEEKPYALANGSRTVFYTPEALRRPKTLMDEIRRYGDARSESVDASTPISTESINDSVATHRAQHRRQDRAADVTGTVIITGNERSKPLTTLVGANSLFLVAMRGRYARKPRWHPNRR